MVPRCLNQLFILSKKIGNSVCLVVFYSTLKNNLFNCSHLATFQSISLNKIKCPLIKISITIPYLRFRVPITSLHAHIRSLLHDPANLFSSPSLNLTAYSKPSPPPESPGPHPSPGRIDHRSVVIMFGLL